MDKELFCIDALMEFLSSYTRVTEEEKATIENMVIYKYFKKNEIVARQGEISTEIAIIIKGSVRYLNVNDDGDEYSQEFFFEGETISDFKGFDVKTPCESTCMTIEPTYFVVVTYESFISFLNLYPRYYPILTNVISEAVLKITERSNYLRIQSARERYERLCELRPKVIERVPLTYIASYLGMALGTLSRVRAGKL